MQLLEFLTLGYKQKSPKVASIHETEISFVDLKESYGGTYKFYKVFANYIVIFKLTLGCPWAPHKSSPRVAQEETIEYNR